MWRLVMKRRFSSSLFASRAKPPQLRAERSKGHAVIILTAAAILSMGPTQAAVFDLTSQWSDVSNPNGVWSYDSGGVALTSVVRASDPWTTSQISWGDLPGWFRSNGTEQF